MPPLEVPGSSGMKSRPGFVMSPPSPENFRVLPPPLAGLGAHLVGWIPGHVLPLPLPLVIWLSLVTLGLATWLLSRSSTRPGKASRRTWTALALCLIALGLERGASVRTTLARRPPSPEARPWVGDARVVGLPWCGPLRGQDAEAPELWTRFETRSPALEVLARGRHPDLRAGQRVRLHGRVTPSRRRRNPGISLPRRPAAVRLLVSSPECLEILPGSPDSTPRLECDTLISSFRARALERLRELHPPENAGILGALLLGERRGLPDEFRRDLIHTGTYHFLAISGLHLGIVLSLFRGVRRWLPLRLLALGLVVLLTGAAPPVIRAALMVALTWIARAAGRNVRGIDVFAWTVLILALAEPTWILEAGFQLSVGAVGAILLLAAPLERSLAGSPLPGRDRSTAGIARPLRRLLARVLAASLAAWLGTLPVLLLHFHRLHPLGVAWSVTIYPLVLALLVLGLAGLLAGSLHPVLAAPLVPVLDGGLDLLRLVVGFLADVPGSSILAPAPSGVTLLLAGLLLVLGLRVRRRPGRRRVTRLLAGLATLGALLVSLSRSPAPGLWILDVGAGSSILHVGSEGTRILIDVGSSGAGPRLGEEVARSLTSLGVRRLDALVLTHKDVDHTGGLAGLVDALPVSQVITSRRFGDFEGGRSILTDLDRRGLPHRTLSRGEHLTPANRAESSWRLVALAPGDSDPPRILASPNDSSLVLLLVAGDHRVLLGGDIEEAGTAGLLMSGQDLRADILVAPHHGRANHLEEPLLRAVRPRHVVISGRSEDVSEDLLEALERRGLEPRITGREGALRVRLPRESPPGIESLDETRRTDHGTP